MPPKHIHYAGRLMRRGRGKLNAPCIFDLTGPRRSCRLAPYSCSRTQNSQTTMNEFPESDPRPCALILAPFAERELVRLAGKFRVEYQSWMDSRRIHDPEELATKINSLRAAILVVELDFVFEEVFRAAADLNFVGTCRFTTSHVDIEAATAHGVAVVNTPGRNSQAVAEHALGLLLALARRIPESHQYVKAGHWNNPLLPYMEMRGTELAGKTLGIVGLGAIGRRLALVAEALGMTCIAYDPFVHDPPSGIAVKDLDEVLADSDFVSIHAPLTEETDGMIDSGRLSLMKSTAYLLNLSEARVVDRDALVDALESKKIRGAALDVFETHPIAPDHPLLQLDNVILTPHLGGATMETIDRYSKMIADDVLRFMGGKRPVNLINPAVWESR